VPPHRWYGRGRGTGSVNSRRVRHPNRPRLGLSLARAVPEASDKGGTDMTITRIPAEAVVILRSALLSELGVPASRIEEASITQDKEKHPELFLQPLALLDDHRAVLHLLGWGEPDIQEALSLDLDPHREVIAKAMRTRLEVERDYMSEHADVKGQRDTAAHNARVIEEFLNANGLRDRE